MASDPGDGVMIGGVRTPCDQDEEPDVPGRSDEPVGPLSADFAPPRRLKDLRADQPHPPSPLGGTTETPDHSNPSGEPLVQAPCWLKIVVGSLFVFGCLSAALWIAGELGGRRTAALISSALVLAGVLLIRYARPTVAFTRELQQERHRRGLPVEGRDGLMREQLTFRLFVGGTLIGLASLGFVLALTA